MDEIKPGDRVRLVGTSDEAIVQGYAQNGWLDRLVKLEIERKTR